MAGVIEAPVWMDNPPSPGNYAAGMDRSVLFGAYPTPGVLAPDCVVAAGSTTTAPGLVAQTAAGANQAVDINVGRIIVAESGPTNASWRNYLCKHSGAAGTVTNVAMPAAPVGGNPRYDAVCVLVNDSTVSGGTNNWTWDIVQGTAAASPAFPTVTGMRTVLAYVLRPNANNNCLTANITNVANRLWFEGGTRLGYAKYNPGTFTQSTTITNAFAPIASSWYTTFTVPASGKVLVKMSMYTGWSWTAGGTVDQQGVYWAVVDSSNTAPAGASYAIHHVNDGVGAGQGLRRNYYEAHVTGLTPGAVLTWWPAWRKSSANSGTAYNQVSSANGDFWLKVYADA